MSTDSFFLSPATRALKELVSQALLQSEEPPMLAAVELLAQTCIRAAMLYPEWAEIVTAPRADGLDDFARRLVARSVLGSSEAGG
ncbi:MAG: hypothetical protein AB7J35_09690 [Dehalococcoidia bacterium]